MIAVRLTTTAKNQILKLIKEHNVSNMLFSIKSGGCNGFNYNLTPVRQEPHNNEEFVNIDNNSKLIICNKSLLYVLGSTIDWKTDIMGSYFRFENPNAESSCGCGKSFN